MELSFSELRAKEVINTQDGRKLGRVCDVALCYPEGKWIGIVVPGGRGFSFKKNSLFIDLRHIVKIGEDVVLVDVGLPQSQKNCKRPRGNMPTPTPYDNMQAGRNYEEYE